MRKRRFNAVEEFKSCPACDSPNLLKFEGDMFCLYCDWHTICLREDIRFEQQIARNRLKAAEEVTDETPNALPPNFAEPFIA